jgi:hypothetical protein
MTPERPIKQTPIRVFDWLGFLCEAAPSTSLTASLDEVGLYSQGIYFIFDGTTNFTAINPYKELPPQGAGWLNTNHPPVVPDGCNFVRLSFTEKCKWFCLSRSVNKTLPIVSPIVKADGEKFEIYPNDKIFVLKGSVLIKDKTFVAPTSVKNSDTTITCTADGDFVALKFF